MSAMCRRPSVVLVVFMKEMRESLRDRRTLFTILLTAVLMGPAALALIAGFISGLEERGAARELYVDGLQRAPQMANFLARNDVKVLPAPAAYEQAIRKGDLQEAVLVIPADFSAKWARGETVTLRLVFDDSRSRAQQSIRLAEALVRGFGRENGTLRLLERGISPRLLGAVELERVNTATPKQQAAFLLFLIPMFALLGAVVGGMSAAIDSTAGERERGSLEPLLMNPVDVRALVFGKWLAVAAHSVTVVSLTLGGFALATHFLSSERMSAVFQFGLPELLGFGTLAIPFAGLIAALQMLVATFGRSHKEAQTYASYIALVINFVPLVTVFAPVREALWQAFVPALAQQMAMARILRGDTVSNVDYMIPLGVSVVLTALCLSLLTRLLRREGIVFGR